MSKKLTDDEIVQGVKSALERKADALDARTRSKLNQARQRALAELGRAGTSRAIWLPAGATACAVLAAAVWIELRGPATAGPDVTAASADDFEILMAEDSIEMFEDLEFFEVMDLLDEPGGTIG